MQSYKTIWYKDTFFRLFYLINGIILLILLNWIIVIFLNWWVIPLWYYWLIIISAYFFYKIYKLFNNIKYEFNIDDIIIRFWKKSYRIFLKDIDKIEKIINIPIVNLFWLRYNPLSKELFYVTSYKKILKVNMQNWEIIYISPKKFDEATFKFYNNTLKWKK